MIKRCSLFGMLLLLLAGMFISSAPVHADEDEMLFYGVGYYKPGLWDLQHIAAWPLAQDDFGQYWMFEWLPLTLIRTVLSDEYTPDNKYSLADDPYGTTPFFTGRVGYVGGSESFGFGVGIPIGADAIADGEKHTSALFHIGVEIPLRIGLGETATIMVLPRYEYCMVDSDKGRRIGFDIVPYLTVARPFIVSGLFGWDHYSFTSAADDSKYGGSGIRFSILVGLDLI